MKLFLKILGYFAVFILGAVGGFIYEFWNTPLAEPFCVARGSQVFAIMVKNIPYWVGWTILGFVACVPLYGIWIKYMRSK